MSLMIEYRYENCHLCGRITRFVRYPGTDWTCGCSRFLYYQTDERIETVRLYWDRHTVGEG